MEFINTDNPTRTMDTTAIVRSTKLSNVCMNGPGIPNLLMNFPCQSHRKETLFTLSNKFSYLPLVTDPTQPYVPLTFKIIILRTSNSLALTDHGSELLVRQDRTDWILR